MQKMLKKVLGFILIAGSLDLFVFQCVFAMNRKDDEAKGAEAAKADKAASAAKAAEADRAAKAAEADRAAKAAEADRAAKAAKETPEAPKEAPKAEAEAPKKEMTSVEKKEAAKTEAQKLYEEQYALRGGSQDPADMGVWDKKFNSLGHKLIQMFPGLTAPIMRRSIEVTKKFSNSPASRFLVRANDASKRSKAWLNETFIPFNRNKNLAQWKDVDELNKNPKKRKEILDNIKDNLIKNLASEYKQKPMTEEDALKKAQEKVVEDLANPKTVNNALKEELDRINLQKIVAKQIADMVNDPKLFKKKMDEVIKDLKTKAQDKFGKIAEQSSIKPEDIEKMVKDPEIFTKTMSPEQAAVREELVKTFFEDQIKDDIKRTWFDKYDQWKNDLRQKATSIKLLGIGMLGSLIGPLMGIAIGKAIETSTKGFLTDVSKIPLIEAVVQEPKMDRYGNNELTPEDQKSLDSIVKLAEFFSGFDAKFKAVLSTFDYESTVFQATEKLKYAGGECVAGMALLFNYKGAGNIAEGLTPIVARFYPMQVEGSPIDPMQTLVGVTNLDALELIAALRSCRPDVIFLIKVISLLNTANKKFTDLGQRKTFFSEQMNMLFSRLLRTVDDEATRRANILEKDDQKWDSIYMQNPSQCFQSAPKVIRDFMAELMVDTLDEDGKQVKLSFEEFIINQFAMFDDVLRIEFDGDLDYHVEPEELDDVDVAQRVFAIFMRALDDVLKVEKEMLKKTAPVKIKDALDKESMFDCKKNYMDVTQVAFDNLTKAQAKIIDVSIDYAADMANEDRLKAYNDTYKVYMNTLDLYIKSTLEFRKKACFYPYEKTLGYAKERVLDFVKRECKRAYQEAKNKNYFLSVLPKIFEPFASNFPFSIQDLLKYSQELGPVRSPIKLIIQSPLGNGIQVSKSPIVSFNAEGVLWQKNRSLIF